MNIKKKKYKSFRFWVISLLAVSTAAFSTSLVLSSCTTTSNNNDQEIKSDVTISKEPETNQEVSADQVGGLTLTIEAKSEKGKQLNYQWYVNKGDGTNWQQIQGATTNSYTIPSSELETVKAESTWQYKAEIKYNDGTDAKFESNTYAVKVKPTSTTNTISFTTDLATSTTITAGVDATFKVDATTNISGATLTYDWYLVKGNEAATKVQSGTSNTYTIKGTDTSSFTDTQNWKLYVEAYPNSNNNLKAKSNECAITINPKTSGGTETPKGTISFTTNLSESETITAGDSKTFTVLATTQNVTSPSITYEWLVDKTGNGTSYTSVQSSDKASYTIPANETQSIESTATWKVQVKAYVTSDKTITTTSTTCTLTINPKSSGGGTTPSPEVPPSQYETVYPRANDYTFNSKGSGLTTVKYEQEKWIGDNSVSIAVVCEPNMQYVKNYLANYITSNAVTDNSTSDEQNAHKLISELNDKINSENTNKDYSIIRAYNGTGWMLDYSSNSNGSINYYLGTNLHVIDANYSFYYFSNMKTENSGTVNAEVTLTIPISKESVNSVSVYLSQPRYNETSAADNNKVPFKDLSTAWHKTPIDINNFYDSLVNVGTFNSTVTPQLATPYDMKLNYYYEYGSSKTSKDLYLEKNKAATATLNKSNQSATDFGVLKITESADAFSKFAQGTTWTTMFQKMQTMFNVNTDDKSATAKSSYIARLNSLLTMLNGDQYTKEEASKLFMFADYKTDLTSTTTLSVAGFPQTNITPYSYSNFNSNTLSYSLSKDVAEYDKQWRQDISFNNNGSLYFSNYDWKYDKLIPNVDLMGGASGSMTVTQDYKITGIYFGNLTYTNQLYGIISKLYSQSDNMSMIKLWLQYIRSKDSGSKLVQLFTALNSKNFFS